MTEGEWNVLTTGVEVSYKSQWNSPWFVIREFFQNALDEHDHLEIKELPQINRVPGGIEIVDQGAGVGASSLLFREVKKDPRMRGEFGEGLKWASLAALRLGYGVKIESPKVEIVPELQRMVFDGEEVSLLSFKWRNREDQSKVGTQVFIGGYKDRLYEDRFFHWVQKDVPMRWDVTSGGKTSSIVLAGGEEHANRLYVGDIYVKELGLAAKRSRFAYNMWGVNLDPDRVQVRDSAMFEINLTEMWLECKNVDMIAELLKALREGEWESTIYWYSYAAINKEAWREAWVRIYGAETVMGTDEYWRDSAKHDGTRVIDMPERMIPILKKCEIPTDRKKAIEYHDKFEDKTSTIEDTKLDARRRNNLNALRLLTREIGMKDVEIYAAMLPDMDGRQVEGVVQSKIKTFFVSVDKLFNFLDALDVAIHELGHINDAGSIVSWHNSTTDVAVAIIKHLWTHGKTGPWAMADKDTECDA